MLAELLGQGFDAGDQGLQPESGWSLVSFEEGLGLGLMLCFTVNFLNAEPQIFRDLGEESQLKRSYVVND